MTKTAIITGGAGGMGLATARIMGADHRLVITDVNREKLDAAVAELVEAGVDAIGVRGDITDRASVEEVFAAAGDGLRAVVHSAGVSPQMGDAGFIFKINAVGTVNVNRAFLERAGEGGAIVNVASIAGHMSPDLLQPKGAFKRAFDDDLSRLERGLLRSTKMMPAKMRAGAAYGTSKAFVIWYSREIAAAFGAKGARVVSVSPGTFDTEMGRLEVESGSDKLIDYAAIKRFGKPEEVAAVMAFAASEAPGYLTGTDILVDGGTKAGLGLKGMLALARGA